MSNIPFTLRLPVETYRELKEKNTSSMTQFVVEAIQEKLAKLREEELRRGFSNLAQPDPEAEEWQSPQKKAMGNVNG